MPKLPKLPGKLSLLNLPTPLELVGGDSGFWIKRDDLTGIPYGGNKPRKLEFLLKNAMDQGVSTIVTTGATGSNHCLATTVYAKQLGFEVHLIMFPQPTTPIVEHHFEMVQRLGAVITLGSEYDEFEGIKNEIMTTVTNPYFIPAGGSCGLGCMGYVQAAFELKEQIEAGVIPMIDSIFCAAGTLGTLAGLAVGLKLADLNIKLIGVRVVDEIVTNWTEFKRLVEEVSVILAVENPSFCCPNPEELNVTLIDSFFGEGYGVVTEEATAAMNWMKQHESVKLDPTYTAKTVAAILQEKRNAQSGEPVMLYWHTFDTGFTLNPEILNC